MRRRITLAVALLLAFFAMAPQSGCLPVQKIDVSPDGKTMYFALTVDAGFRTEDPSNLYSLDVETGRLRALTDGPLEKGWCAATPDGAGLFYMQYTGQVCVQEAILGTGASFPVTGAADPSAYPWVIPGEDHYLLLFHGQWTLFRGESFEPLPLSLPGSACSPTAVAVAENRFAVAISRETGKDDKKGAELRVCVVDITKKQVPNPNGEGTKDVYGTTVTETVPWKFAEAGLPGRIDLAFTSDGKRLAALLVRQDGNGECEFYEVDAAGNLPPRLLFKDREAFQLGWAPDGKGLVYLRNYPGLASWREVVLRPIEDAPAVVLARLPGGVEGAATCWRFNDDGTLTIYHLSDDGVEVVRTDPAGKAPEVKKLSHEKLAVQQRLADVEIALQRAASLPAPPAGGMQQPVDIEALKQKNEALQGKEPAGDQAPAPAAQELPPLQAAVERATKPVYDRLKARDLDVREALEAAWKDARAWEKTAALPDMGRIILEDRTAKLDGARSRLQQKKVVDGKEVPALSADEKKAVEAEIRQLEAEIDDIRKALKDAPAPNAGP